MAVLPGFLRPEVIESLRLECESLAKVGHFSECAARRGSKCRRLIFPTTTRGARSSALRSPRWPTTQVVALENDRGLPTTYMYTETVAVPKQIRGDGLGAGVFGTNFTFDDFERFMSLNRTEESKRLSDETREGHPSFVLVSTPRDPIRGSYTKVKTWVYGDQERVRRVLKADLDRIVTKDGLSYPGRITLRDLTEGTQTQLDITSSEIDGKLVSQGELEVGELGRYCR